MKSKKKPYILFVAEIIYLNVCKIKKKNSNFSNIDSVENFIGSEIYQEISSGKFHDNWFNELKNNNFIDKETGEKIPLETIKLLEIQRNTITKELKISDLYYSKSSYPLESSQKAFNLLWRMCESYELWCKETKQIENLDLNIVS